jgi:hypothetical protein
MSAPSLGAGSLDARRSSRLGDAAGWFPDVPWTGGRRWGAGAEAMEGDPRWSLLTAGLRWITWLW